MRLRITKIGSDRTVTYAAEELSKYLCRMDRSLRVEEFLCDTYEEYCQEPTDSILLGVGIGVKENDLDDQIRIAVECGKGVITGANPRSVLFAVYRFLYALGGRFPSPEECSEVIPSKTFVRESFSVACTDTPAYRHRGIDLGGAIDYQMCTRCINWMPKLGLNAVLSSICIRFKVSPGFTTVRENRSPAPNPSACSGGWKKRSKNGAFSTIPPVITGRMIPLVFPATPMENGKGSVSPRKQKNTWPW